MDETRRKGRRARHSRKQGLPPNDASLMENKTARRIQSQPVRIPSKWHACIPTSNQRQWSGNTVEHCLETRPVEVPFEAKCNDGPRRSSSTNDEVRPTPGVESGKSAISSRERISRHFRVPSVVYVSPVRPPKRPTRLGRIRPASLHARPRLELLEDELGLAIDTSTTLNSPSTHSVPIDVYLEIPRKAKQSARFGEIESKDATAPRPPQRQASHRLTIPKAQICVPDRERKLGLSRRTTLAHSLSEPPSKNGNAPETSSRPVQLQLPRMAQTIPSSQSAEGARIAFHMLHPLSHPSRIARNTGPKVTVVSEEFKIFVVDLLSDEHCDWVIQCAERHTAGAIASGRETWRKIYTHTCLDLPCCEVLALRPMTDRLLIHIRQIVGKTWKARRAASGLAPRSWKEPHLLRYQKAPGQSEHDHTGMIMHHDGGDLSWQLMLSEQGIDYTGGGTYFRCLRKTIILRKGQVLVHPGNLYHRGVDITAGTRTLMVCFMDGFDPHVNDPSSLEEDSVEFQRNLMKI